MGRTQTSTCLTTLKFLHEQMRAASECDLVLHCSPHVEDSTACNAPPCKLCMCHQHAYEYVALALPCLQICLAARLSRQTAAFNGGHSSDSRFELQHCLWQSWTYHSLLQGDRSTDTCHPSQHAPSAVSATTSMHKLGSSQCRLGQLGHVGVSALG